MTAPRRRGIYVLPNLFTTTALFAGFYSIMAAVRGQIDLSAIAIVVAAVLDGLDGRVARLTNTESDFGAQYDSMADMVAFGVAPALLMYQWVLLELGKVGWMVSFVYVAAVALRLARFNVQSVAINKRYFQGLPSPPSAVLIISLVWLGHRYHWDGGWTTLFAAAVTLGSAALMVSNARYHSFKEIDFRHRIRFVWVSVFVLALAVFFTDPPSVLFLMSISYAASGPALTLFLLRRKRLQRLHKEIGSQQES